MKHTKLLLVVCTIVVLQCMLGHSKAGDVLVSYYDYDKISDLIWSGPNIVFMLTTTNILYKSIDEGQTWVVQFQSSTSSVVEMYQDPKDDKRIVFLANGLKSGWTTVDAGAHYSDISFGFEATSVQFNPNITGALLFTEGSCVYGCNVYVSKDFGQTTTPVGKSWLDASWNVLENGAPFDAVYGVDANFNFGYAHLGGSFTTLFKNSLGFVFTTKHLFVGVFDKLNKAVLKVSSGGYTDAANYKEAKFPFGDDLPIHGFTFLDDTTGGEWIGLTHSNIWGNIYTSDATGVKYITALNHIYQAGLIFDFDMFHGLEGIYIANVVTNYENANNKDSALRSTLVTFDNGGEWRKLAAPRDANNQTYCTGKCSLHLHGINDYIYSDMSPFYSTENAIGLFLATGNVGESLVTKPELVSLYFSRDAGLTWMELARGPHIYEYGDHGGIIVFAQTGSPTQQIKYSLDEGLTTKVIALDFPVIVDNIIVEPSATSHKFILYGQRASNSKNIVIGLNFAGVQPRTCVDADYETWSPTDGRQNGQTCQLGRTVTYVRRRRDSNCFNDRETEHIQSVVNCDCALEDYECDFGFEESFVDGKSVCVVDTDNPPADPPSDCPPGTTYEVSSGRRLVAGDSCVGEITEFRPTIKNCPAGNDNNGKTNKALVAVVVIFVLFALIGIAGFFVYRNEEWREKFLSVVGKVIPINRGATYSRLGRQMLANDEEFAIGGDQDLDDSDVEEDAPELQDHDIQRATSTDRRGDDFNPRT